MRSRSTSPIHPYAQRQKRYYSREEVSAILRAMLDSKIAKIYEQLDQKQQVIRALNEKLNRNDSYIQGLNQQIYSLTEQCSRSSQMQAESCIELVNSMLNQKLQGYWRTVQAQFQKIRNECQQGIRAYQQSTHEKTSKCLAQIRNRCEQSVESFKKKNNAYWIKVKEVLNKVNTRTTQNEQKITNIGLQIAKFEKQRQENGKTLKQLQNGQNTAKMLVQLKKSVTNVYKNFEQVLKLQQSVKQRYERMGSIDKLGWDRPQNSETLLAKANWNTAGKGRSTRQQDIVILEYSVEQDTMSHQQAQINLQKQPNSYGLIQKPSQAAKRAGNPPLSPITGKVVETSALSSTLDMLGSDRYKMANTNNSSKNQTYEWLQNYGGTEPLHTDNSNSFQISPHNESNFALSAGKNPSHSRSVMNPNNVSSTSMLNFSIECRRQTLDSVRQRLVELIETKGMGKPVRVFLDQINYLKNQQGNYVFDLRGNMFKLTPQQFAELQKEKVLANIKTQPHKITKLY